MTRIADDIDVEVGGGLRIGLEGLRDGDEYSLVKVAGNVGIELADALKDVAYAIRGLPGWTEPDQ